MLVLAIRFGSLGRGRDVWIQVKPHRLASSGELRAEVEALDAKTLAKIKPVGLLARDARDELDLAAAERTTFALEPGDQLRAVTA